MDKTRRSQAFPKHQPHSLKIHISNRQKDLPLDRSRIRAAVRELTLYLKIVCDEISIYFVSEKRICALHAQFFDDPSPTDCITFPVDDAHLGEIFICPAAAIAYATPKKLDPYRETALYLIHGMLHLIGYNDLEPPDRKAMRIMEKRCMDHLIKRGISLGRIPT